MLVANREIAMFFKRRGGLVFSIGGVLFHQVYYLYSASAFAWVVMERLAGKLFGIKTPS